MHASHYNYFDQTPPRGMHYWTKNERYVNLRFMPEKLTGSLLLTPPSRLRGSLARAARTAVSGSLRGSLAERRSGSIEPGLIPDDYDMDPEVAKRVIAKQENPELVQTSDPDGIVAPGLVLESATSPDKRRLITNLYENSAGNTIATVHTEGSLELRNFRLSALHQNIDEGALIPVAPITADR